MSFYGNILNRLDRWRLKVGNKTISTENEQEIQLTGTNGIAISTSASNTGSQIQFSGEGLVNNVAIGSSSSSTVDHTTQTITLTQTMGNGDESTSTIDVHIPTLSISELGSDSDNKLKYTITYGGNSVGVIDIPLDLMLESGEVITITKDNQSQYDDTTPGIYLCLTLKTESGRQKVYIDVKSLNEIAGNKTDTIEVKVDNDQKITAALLDNSIKAKHLTSDAVNSIQKFETDILTVNPLGGIAAGVNLNGQSVQSILKTLLFPYVDASVGNATATPNGGTYEYGTTKTITQVKITVSKKSEPITSVALYNGSILIEEKTGDTVRNGGTFTFSNVNVVVPTDGNKLTVKVTYPDASGNPKTVSKDTTALTFVYPYYTGVCAEGATINQDLVLGLTKVVEGKSNKTNWSYTCNNQSVVFAYPKKHGNLSKIIDPNNFDITNAFAKHEVSVTGTDGTEQVYYVYVNGAATVTDFQIDFNY